MTVVSLRSVSGKHCALSAPFSWDSFLSACEAELGFDRETVKARYDGHVRRLADVASSEGSVADVDITKFNGTVATPLPAAPTEVSVSTSDETEKKTLKEEQQASRTGLSILVFGRPRKLADLHAAQTRLRRPPASPRPRNPSIASSHHVIGNRREFPGPLPYPHCPDGLRDLDRIVSTGQELRDIFPVEVYRHPTMQYIIRESFGDMEYLHAVMEQISRATPSFFEWIRRNPHGFVRMLNRNEPTLQELRTTALLQLVQQLSSEVAQGRHEFTVEIDGDFAPGVELHVTLDAAPFDSDSDGLFDSESGGDGDDGEDDADHEYGEDMSGVYGEEVFSDTENADNTIWAGGHGVQFVDTQTALLAAFGIHVPSADEPPSSGVPSPLTAAATSSENERAEEAAPLDTRATGINMNTATTVASQLPASIPVEASTEDASPTSFSSSSPCLPSPHTPTENAPRNPQNRILTSFVAVDDEEAAAVVPADAPSPSQGDAAQVEDWVEQAESLEKRMTAARVVGAYPDWQSADPTLSSDAARFSDAVFAQLQVYLSQHGVSDAAPSSFPFLRLASHFFADLEELYVLSVEKSSPFVALSSAADPVSSLAGCACCAALSQQLVCACDALLSTPPPLGTVPSDASVANGTPTSVRRQMTDGRLRAGALHNFPDTRSVLLEPVVRWVCPGGSQALLRALLNISKTQPAAALLWYTSHYVIKREGKTVQTVGYVLDGTHVRLVRLPFNSKAHRHDEVAEVMSRIETTTAQSGGGGGTSVPDALRAEWGLLMKRLYKNMVKPLEAYLPTPNATANPLYVVDTRHILNPRNPEKTSSTAAVPKRSPACWFGGYSDDKNMLCADKWCITQSERPWHIVVADEAPWSPLVASQPLALLLLGTPSTTAPYWLTEPLQGVYHFHQYAMSVLPPAAVHAVVLHEADCGLRVPSVRRRTSRVSDRPIVADLRVVDDCDVDSSDRLAPQRATLAHNAQLSFDEEFYTLLYEKLAIFPTMSLAAAVRAVSLSLMVQYKAPWRVVEFSLMDYGGPLATLAPLFDMVRRQREQRTSVTAAETPLSMAQDSISQEYARSNGMLNVFESMLSHVMEERPPTTRAVLDSLIEYVGSSKTTLKQQVRASTAAAATTVTETAQETAAQETAAQGAARHRSIPTQPPPAQAGSVRSPHAPTNPPGKGTAHRTFPRHQSR